MNGLDQCVFLRSDVRPYVAQKLCLSNSTTFGANKNKKQLELFVRERNPIRTPNEPIRSRFEDIVAKEVDSSHGSLRKLERINWLHNSISRSAPEEAVILVTIPVGRHGLKDRKHIGRR